MILAVREEVSHNIGRGGGSSSHNIGRWRGGFQSRYWQWGGRGGAVMISLKVLCVSSYSHVGESVFD